MTEYQNIIPRIILILAIGTVLSQCTNSRKPPKDPVKETIREAMWNTLTYPGTYSPVEITLDSAFFPELIPERINIQHDLSILLPTIAETQKRIAGAEASMSLWRGPKAEKPNKKKYEEAKLFRNAMQHILDSLTTRKDSLQARLNEINSQPISFAGFLANVRYVHINADKDTVYAREYLLLDPSKTTVISQWPEEKFTKDLPD